MFGLIKKFSQNKIFYSFIIILLVLSAQVLNKPAEAEMKSIVIAIGIDKVEDSDKDIELTAGVVSPKGEANLSANTIAVSARGDSINSAFYNLGLQLGKKISLSHCELVIVSEKLFEENVIKYLDFFIRTNNLTTNSILVAAQDKAKELIEATTDVEDLYSQSLKNMMDFDDDFLYGVDMSIESFYNAYFSNQKLAVLAVLESKKEGDSLPNVSFTSEHGLGEHISLGDYNIKPTQQDDDLVISLEEESKQENEGGEKKDAKKSESSGMLNISSEGEEGGAKQGGEEQGGGGKEEEKKQVAYRGRLMVVKEGKKVRYLTPSETQSFKMLDANVRTMYVALEDVNTADYKNAKILLEGFYKNAKVRMFFNNDVPVVNINLEIHFKVDEIMGDNYTKVSIGDITSFFSDYIRELIVIKLKSDMSEFVSNMQEYNTDILAVFDNFYKLYNKKWKSFLKTLPNPEKYLDHVVYQMNIKINNKV